MNNDSASSLFSILFSQRRLWGASSLFVFLYMLEFQCCASLSKPNRAVLRLLFIMCMKVIGCKSSFSIKCSTGIHPPRPNIHGVPFRTGCPPLPHMDTKNLCIQGMHLERFRIWRQQPKIALPVLVLQNCSVFKAAGSLPICLQPLPGIVEAPSFTQCCSKYSMLHSLM